METKNFTLFLKTVILAACLFILSGTTYAQQPPIKIILHYPPPDKMSTGDLWKLDVTNSSKDNIRIYLTGTASESQKGLIVTGRTKVFSVSPGAKTYTYEDFKSGEVSWKNKSVQESVVRTGNVPEGEYTICVTAFYENNEVADQESCIEQSVKQQGSISLISPEDGSEIDPNVPLIFTWTPLQGATGYDLKIAEIKGGQSPEEAINGSAFYEKKGLNITSFQYPIDAPKMKDGKKYAWQVKSGEAVSGVRYLMIVITTSTSTITTTLELIPFAGGGCCDSIHVHTTGSTASLFNAFRIRSGGAITNNISSAWGGNAHTNPSTITTPVSSVTWNAAAGTTFYNQLLYGYVCFADLTGPFTMVVEWSSDGGSTFVVPGDTITVTCQPTCNVQNPSFENVVGTLSTTGNNPITATNVPGWVSLFNDPDICPAPTNWGGTQNAFDGTYYAGLSCGGGQTEVLGGTMTPTVFGKWYNVHARFSQAEIRTPTGVWVEIYLRDGSVVYDNANPITWGQRVGGMLVNDFTNWQLFSADIQTTHWGYNQIMIKGDINATPQYFLGYVFIDSVNVCPIPPPSPWQCGDWADDYTDFMPWNHWQDAIVICVNANGNNTSPYIPIPAFPSPGIHDIIVTGGVCSFDSVPDGADIRVSREIGNVLLGVNAWQSDFNYKFTDIGAPPIPGSPQDPLKVGHVIFGLTAGELNPINDNNAGNNVGCTPSNQDAVMVIHSNNKPTDPVPTGSDGALYISVKVGTNQETSPQFINITRNIQYYVRLERLDKNGFRLNVFDDAGPTHTHHVAGSPFCFHSTNEPTNLKVLQHSSIPQGGPVRQLTATIDSTCIKVLGAGDCCPLNIRGKSIICETSGLDKYSVFTPGSYTWSFSPASCTPTFTISAGTDSITITNWNSCSGNITLSVTKNDTCNCHLITGSMTISVYPGPPHPELASLSCDPITNLLTVSSLGNQTAFGHSWGLRNVRDGICGNGIDWNDPPLQENWTSAWTSSIALDQHKCYNLGHGMSNDNSPCGGQGCSWCVCFQNGAWVFTLNH